MNTGSKNRECTAVIIIHFDLGPAHVFNTLSILSLSQESRGTRRTQSRDELLKDSCRDNLNCFDDIHEMLSLCISICYRYLYSNLMLIFLFNTFIQHYQCIPNQYSLNFVPVDQWTVKFHSYGYVYGDRHICDRLSSAVADILVSIRWSHVNWPHCSRWHCQKYTMRQ